MEGAVAILWGGLPICFDERRERKGGRVLNRRSARRDGKSYGLRKPSLGKDENTRLAVIGAVVVNARYRLRALVCN
jgi:hypothetical protein